MLGVLSRMEETSGLPACISTNAAWVALAFAVGSRARGAAALRAAGAGALALTAANAAYYASIAAAEPGVELAAVAGPPLGWFALGVSGGAVFGAAGLLWSGEHGARRVIAALPLAGVCVAQGIAALRGGSPGDAVALLLGVALPVASATSARERVLGGGLVAAVVAVALTGWLDALMP